MRVALDSNVLLYAEIEPESAKGVRAREIILSASRDGVIPVQVIGEFLRVVQRRARTALPEAMRQADIYVSMFITPPTSHEVMKAAAVLAADHGLQIWDAVICAASHSAGAQILLTEDLQDRRSLNGMLLLNPFEPRNHDEIARALG